MLLCTWSSDFRFLKTKVCGDIHNAQRFFRIYLACRAKKAELSQVTVFSAVVKKW
jgi:hypothetical protein